MSKPRIRYKNSPLKEVIFQLRFPTILSINANEPVEFQEKIRAEYPLYRNVEEPKRVESKDGKEIVVETTRKYEFISADGLHKVTLASSFIAFSTLGYNVWVEFKKNIEQVVRKFQSIYKPPFYVRIGLRYKDVISKTQYTTLSGKRWSELVKPEVIGIISNIDENDAQEYQMMSLYKQASDHSMVRNQFGFVYLEGEETLSLLLDCDYFQTELTSLDKMLTVAESLHEHSRNFIDNSITPALREAMQPEEI